ncbi:MAG: DNA (cytosine-5-)-methyltransferase [Clostridia bacterium]|nr:DNA (cytosine-5-)-methyltransferase [Clostridia bacterium]
MYNVVSLFCGCGGVDLGTVGGFVFNKKEYAKHPCKLVYACDIDQKAVDSHKLNFDAENAVCADICEVEADDIPECDILTGGFPCQSFSTVNPTKDPFDDRANLYKQMVRIVQAKQPKVFVAENVKGMMTLHKGAIFKRVISAFEEAGYKTFYSLLNAADYGVPQKRERVLIVGIRNDVWEQKGDFVFPAKTHEGNWTPLSVAVPELAIEDKKYYFSERAVQGMKNAKNNMKRGLAQNLNEPCLTVTSHLAKVSLNSRDPVLLVDPAKELYRRFTPFEAARIQSFPDNFKFAGTETTAYRQIGNAIPPVLFWHITNEIIKYFRSK